LDGFVFGLLGLRQSRSPNNNMTDDTQMDPMVGGEEEVAPVAPTEEGMEEAPSEAAPEAGEEEAA